MFCSKALAERESVQFVQRRPMAAEALLSSAMLNLIVPCLSFPTVELPTSVKHLLSLDKKRKRH